MPQPKASLIRLVVMVTLCAPVTSLALSSQPQTPKPGQTASASQAAPVPTFHSTSRIVTLEISAKDKHGKAISGLKASDFQVFEHELGFRKEKQEQKIAFFREVDKKLLAERDTSSLQIPAGIFTNLVTLQKNPVPPTILLVDGLNTEMTAQMQVHVQMVKMLHSLPSDVPVAVFLLGRGLKILQGFTTDPSLLRTALAKAAMPTLGVGSQVDPRDDPDSLSTLMGDMPVSETALSAIQSFEQEQYVSTMDMRVRETVTALISIAHHVAGYPGRKNLLWISSSFPISLNADGSAFNSFRSYENDMRKVSAVLADAKVAVYPIDPGGLGGPRYFQAGSRNRSNALGALGRESQMRFGQETTMDELADQTGGRICVDDNDLGDCVSKAVNDSSAFYEIAYYPDSQKWNGDFRKISVKINQPGVHLSYRQGYFATGEENSKDSKKENAELMQSACEDFLNATAILFAAKPLPPDSPEGLKFYLAIDPTSLTFVPTDDGGQDLKIRIAVCTFDKTGKPLQLMRDPVDRKFSANEYKTLLAMRGLPHIVSIPGPKPAGVRLLVKDVATDRVGSINIRVENLEHPAAPQPAAQTAGAH